MTVQYLHEQPASDNSGDGWIALLPVALSDVEKQCLTAVAAFGSYTPWSSSTLEPDTLNTLEERGLLWTRRRESDGQLVYALTESGKLWLKGYHSAHRPCLPVDPSEFHDTLFNEIKRGPDDIGVPWKFATAVAETILRDYEIPSLWQKHFLRLGLTNALMEILEPDTEDEGDGE